MTDHNSRQGAGKQDAECGVVFSLSRSLSVSLGCELFPGRIYRMYCISRSFLFWFGPKRWVPQRRSKVDPRTYARKYVRMLRPNPGLRYLARRPVVARVIGRALQRKQSKPGLRPATRGNPRSQQLTTESKQTNNKNHHHGVWIR
jgi:hypothetical protein